MILNFASLGKSKTLLGFWAAPLYAAMLSALIMTSFWMVKPHSYDFSALLCFLPMAFFFGAVAQVDSQKQVRALQQRIEQLEAQAARKLV